MGLSVSMTSCSDDDDDATPSDGTNTSIAELKALVTGDAAVLISEDKIFDGIVTSNNAESSNFYKSIYIQDETGAIKISCDKPADKGADAAYDSYEIGQKVQVKMKDLYVGKANGLFYVGIKSDDAKYIVGLIADADVATKVVKVDGGVAVEAATATIAALTDDMIGTLVKFEKVQVLREDSKKAIIDGIKLVDETKNTIKVYVYKYSPLKTVATPQGSGSIAGVLYKSDEGYSLSLRLESEINMTAATFDDGTTAPAAPTGTPGINAGTYTGSAATDLFISEYLEGGSNNKYLELFNGTGADIDLSAYSIKLESNENTAWGDAVALAGILPNGATFVIANSGAALTLNDGVTVDVTASKATYFNGNDRVGLFKGETLIDKIGVIADADSNGKTDNFAADVTLVRKATVTDPVTTWNTGEWTVNGKEDVANLGAHTMN